MPTELQIREITKQYRAAKALDSISLDAEGGKIIVLLGVNGAGKTTLLRIIAGLESPEAGIISFNNKVMNAPELRKAATMVFQKTVMFDLSVYDNLAFGLKIKKVPEIEITQKVSESLRMVGLANFEKRKARKTSGGEQQRISLARALLLNPQILLLDEPTANLDPNSARIIEKAILIQKSSDSVIVMATHNLGQAKRLADTVIHIHEGRIIEAASSKDLFDNPQNETTRKFIHGELEF
jgi:tungstate transport system ATP-binding protein